MAPGLLVRTVLVSSLSLAAQAVSGPRPLEGTYWKAIELAGKTVPARDSGREIYLVLQDGGRVYGSDGCNRVVGAFSVKRTSIRFRQMAATRMACLDIGDLDAVFQDALKSARRLAIAGDRLELLDAGKRRVAVFQAVADRPPEPEKR